MDVRGGTGAVSPMRSARSWLCVSILAGVAALSSAPARTASAPAENSVAISLPVAPPTADPLTVGVLPFEARDRKLGEQISGIVAADLSQGNRVSLVERTHLGEVLAELGFSIASVSDPKTAQEVGFLAGAKVLVWGQVFVINRQMMAIGRVVGVETGRVFIEQVRGSADDDLVPLIDELAARLTRRIVSERAALIAPEDKESIQARLYDLAEMLRGTRLPKLAVLVEGGLSGSPSASATQAEFMLWLTRCGVTVIDASDHTGQAIPTSLSQGPVLLLVAEAFGEPTGSRGPLQMARYRLQARVVNRRTGEVIAVARRTGASVDVTLQSAYTSGLRRAAAGIVSELVPRLADYEAKAPPPTAPAPLTSTTSPGSPAPTFLLRDVLFAFTPYSQKEEAATYYENGTHPYADGRGVSYEAQLVYAFKIPPEVSAADCVVTVDNMFLVRVARDDGGKPGEWHVALNATEIFSRRIRDSENRMEYTIDITPYLEDNPSRTVYVSFRPTEFYEAETAVYHVEVAALDDAERARIEKRQRRLDFFIQQDGDGHFLVFQADGNPTELSYLYGDQNPPPGPYGRDVEGNDSLTYRLPLTKKMSGCQIRALVDNTFVVSMALERNGKPGQFHEAARSAARMSIDITPAMIASGAVYLKFEYSRPGDPGGIVVKEVSIRQP